MNSIVNVRMNQEMLTKTETVSKERGYLSVQEYVRETVRQDIERHERLKAELDAIIASAKNVKPHHLTPEERDELARKPLTRIEQERFRKWEEMSEAGRSGSAKGVKMKKSTREKRDGLTRRR